MQNKKKQAYADVDFMRNTVSSDGQCHTKKKYYIYLRSLSAIVCSKITLYAKSVVAGEAR